MSTLTVNGSAVKKMTFKDSSGNEQKVKKWYHNDVKVFSSGNICTYYVDTGDLHTEEIDGEESCLTPKNFTPSKSGWVFVGWREDTTASASVLSSKTMGEDPISLYAVFKRTIAATFNGNGATSGSVSAIYATQYYNNGNYGNPSIALPANGFARTDYAFTGWNLGAAGASVVISGNTIVYAQWRQTIVRLVQNSRAVNGRLIVADVTNSGRWGWYSDSVSCTLHGDGGTYGEDDDYGQNARVYFSSQIPAGKTVYITLRADVVSGNAFHLWNVSTSFLRILNPSDIWSTTSEIASFVSLSNSDSDTCAITRSASYNGNWYVGFNFYPSSYGTIGRTVRFTIVDLYYNA